MWQSYTLLHTHPGDQRFRSELLWNMESINTHSRTHTHMHIRTYSHTLSHAWKSTYTWEKGFTTEMLLTWNLRSRSAAWCRRHHYTHEQPASLRSPPVTCCWVANLTLYVTNVTKVFNSCVIYPENIRWKLSLMTASLLLHAHLRDILNWNICPIILMQESVSLFSFIFHLVFILQPTADPQPTDPLIWYDKYNESALLFKRKWQKIRCFLCINRSSYIHLMWAALPQAWIASETYTHI